MLLMVMGESTVHTTVTLAGDQTCSKILWVNKRVNELVNVGMNDNTIDKGRKKKS